MSSSDIAIEPVGVTDIGTVTRMAYKNMNGSDRQFTKLMANPVTRWASYVSLPFYFLWAGTGYKCTINGQIAGCAYLHLHPNSGYIFNVNVNRPFRQQGIAQRLMGTLERLTVESGRRWTALQVDSDNRAACNLYQKLGYTSLNPSFLRSVGPLSTETAGDESFKLERLKTYYGRQLYKRYLPQERLQGESADLTVIDDYEMSLPGSGPYWRCSYFDQEVGCISVRGNEAQPVFTILFEKAYWGHPSIAGLIQSAVAELRYRPERVDLKFGSGAHYQKAKISLGEFGFKERSLPRLLMFKSMA